MDKKALILVGILIVVAFVGLCQSQYFSSAHTSYARNGKRSYLGAFIRPKQANKQQENDQNDATQQQQQQQPPIVLKSSSSLSSSMADKQQLSKQRLVEKITPLDKYYLADKLSLRKSFNKFGKRNDEQEEDEYRLDDDDLIDILDTNNRYLANLLAKRVRARDLSDVADDVQKDPFYELD